MPQSKRFGVQLRQPRALWLLSALWLLGVSCTRTDPRRDGALVVVLPRAPMQLDPRLVGDAYGLKLSRLLFGSLVTIDPSSLEVLPDLAETVEVVGSTEYRARLRPGVRFSDGSTLDAQDVLATFRSVVAPDIKSRYARTYQRIASMRALDSRTVVFRLTAPHATFLTDLELPILRAEDEHRVVALPGRAAPVGAGPYRLVSRARGELLLESNPHWHGGEVRFGRLRMIVVRDDNTRALRLLAGAADLAVNALPPLLIPLFERSPAFRVQSADGVGTTYLGLNLESAKLKDVRVRRALALALDREALVKAKLGGRARLARGWIAPGLWAYSSDVAVYPFDARRSRRLLDEAGYPAAADGVRMRLALRVSSDRFRISVARAMAAMLREVGIDVTVRPSEVATLLADLNRGRFEMVLLQVPEVIEPHVLSWFFASDRIPEQGVREGANRWRFRSARFDAAIERGRATPVLKERRQAYLEAQQILADQLPVVPLWHDMVVAVANDRARGFVVPRNARFNTLAR